MSETLSGQPIVEARGLTKTYAVGGRKQVVLDGADLVLRTGQLAVLLGRSGSGKSTLLYLLAGILRPDRGEVHLGDQRSKYHHRARLHAELAQVLKRGPHPGDHPLARNRPRPAGKRHT